MTVRLRDMVSYDSDLLASKAARNYRANTLTIAMFGSFLDLLTSSAVLGHQM